MRIGVCCLISAVVLTMSACVGSEEDLQFEDSCSIAIRGVVTSTNDQQPAPGYGLVVAWENEPTPDLVSRPDGRTEWVSHRQFDSLEGWFDGPLPRASCRAIMEIHTAVPRTTRRSPRGRSIWS